MKSLSLSSLSQLEDEVPLILKAMHVMDGGFLAKHSANAGLANQQQFHSDYHLSLEYVDVFKDEVKKWKVVETTLDKVVSELSCIGWALANWNL